MSNYQDILSQIQTIESIVRDPDYYIYEYFCELVRQVDLRRESLKIRIDALSEELIDQIEITRDVFIGFKIGDITTELDLIKIQIQKLNENCDQNIFEELKLRLDYLQDKYKSSLVGYRRHIFKIENLSDQQLFGILDSEVVSEGLKGSKILDAVSVKGLSELCGLCEVEDWELVYRASVDGFGFSDFHSKCDGVARTLTIVKAFKSGYVFGGYTEKEWNQSCGSVFDDKSFIFSLINGEKKPLKIECVDKEHAIYCSVSSGITFGIDDLVVASDSNQNENSYSNLGECYQHIEYPEFCERTQCLLAGARNFQTMEVEVYRRI